MTTDDRRHTAPWCAECDLDILLYGDLQLDSPTLTIPHPRMLSRAFVLVPLAEIAPARVTTVHLQGVEEQGIERLADA